MAPPKKRRGRPPKVQPVMAEAQTTFDAAVSDVATSIVHELHAGLRAILKLSLTEDNESFGEGYQKLLAAVARATNVIYDVFLTVENAPMRADLDAVRAKHNEQADNERITLVERIGSCVNSLVTEHGLSEEAALQVVSKIFGLDIAGGIGTSPIDAMAPKFLDLIMKTFGPKDANGAPARNQGSVAAGPNLD